MGLYFPYQRRFHRKVGEDPLRIRASRRYKIGVAVEEIIKGLWLGSDEDVPEAKRRGYARLCVCKDGPDSHRSMLGYTTLGAPKGKEYLFARRGDVMALNVIDVDDASMMPEEPLLAGIEFIHEMMTAGKKILVHCNAGISRSPTLVMMYMRTIGELDQPFNRAQKIFDMLYPKHDPGAAIEFHARHMWDELKGINISKG
jgi:hypothetical protein